MKIKDKLLGALIALDTVFAALLFTDASDLTISSRCGMAMMDKKAGNLEGISLFEQRILVSLGNGLNWLQKDHCYGSIQGDLRRAQAVMETLFPYNQQLQGLEDIRK